VFLASYRGRTKDASSSSWLCTFVGLQSSNCTANSYPSLNLPNLDLHCGINTRLSLTALVMFRIFIVYYGHHPASYPMGTSGSFPGGKAAGA
jgi:hypothetical protein